MSNKPPPSFSRWHAEMRGERAAPPEVREERLRSMAGMSGSPSVALSAWRGRSAQRYVVGVHDVGSADALEAAPAVVIAVRRDEAGLASPIDVASIETAADAVAWVRLAQASGASEFHIHRLADAASERAAVVADLAPALPPSDHAA
ncbi:hypothetical protein MPPM_3899 [Methylorubrum populi]|uniref:Uncharacterized protein n=2 Tax=Methylorubrum populi TaxID=223967 RepID=A0A160PHY2_9HYPH|nr:hypothetical protein MPPM_3899 [Methylorubrum populi]